MTIFFTSDTHFGHKNIIEFCNRPFKDVNAMDGQMIDTWNSIVQPHDTVFHLGDFCLGDHRPYLLRLHGEKHLCPGNHDKEKNYRKLIQLENGWHSVQGLREIKIEDTKIVLCHYALRVWNQSHRGSLHFYGHSHASLPGDTQSTDVGVDCFGFKPVTLHEIKKQLKRNAPRGFPDYHKLSLLT
jgi:calcineurin-like phosphoesterase family protein